jgi:hypothetical protein
MKKIKRTIKNSKLLTYSLNISLLIFYFVILYKLFSSYLNPTSKPVVFQESSPSSLETIAHERFG